ncbi:MAG: class I SAM-dependent methyltransferase [Acidimicrobiia bacterium]|nr:class I SAM-dependent methyltransferase [Acidimicrobiia bacterium]
MTTTRRGEQDGPVPSTPSRPEDRPSPWVVRFAPLVPAGEPVLDVACGGGRHTRFLLERGHRVVALDRDTSGIEDLRGDPRLEVLEVDLEDGRPFPLRGRRFAAVVVTNYLHRPILPDLVAAVAPGGLLLYETFAAGNERFRRPRRPEFLLRPGELLEAVRNELRVVAYEDVVVDEPRPAAVQRIAAARDPEAGPAGEAGDRP